MSDNDLDMGWPLSWPRELQCGTVTFIAECLSGLIHINNRGINPIPRQVSSAD